MHLRHSQRDALIPGIRMSLCECPGHIEPITSLRPVATFSAQVIVQGECENAPNPHSIFTLGAQDLPDGFDPAIFMDSLYAELKAACPNGVQRCECLNAPGTFTEGPFDPREEVIGSLLTYAGCGPGEQCFTARLPDGKI